MFLFSKGNFPGIPFCRNYVLQKQVLFSPLPPKCNNSPACIQKMSKDVTHNNTTHDKESLLPLLLAAPLLCCPLSPPCQILQLPRLSLVAPSHPSCLVGCCVILVWLVVMLTGALASLPLSSCLCPAPPPLVAPWHPSCLVSCCVA